MLTNVSLKISERINVRQHAQLQPIPARFSLLFPEVVSRLHHVSKLRARDVEPEELGRGVTQQKRFGRVWTHSAALLPLSGESAKLFGPLHELPFLFMLRETCRVACKADS